MKITIENLPPIASGSFELRPLTIFIGPNNTGKTRAALVAYAFCRTMASPLLQNWRPGMARAIRESIPTYERDSADGLDELRVELLADFIRLSEDVLPELLHGYLGIYQSSENSGSKTDAPLGPRLTFSTQTAGGLELTGPKPLITRPAVNVTSDLFPPAQRWLNEKLHRPIAFSESVDPHKEAYWLDLRGRFGWPTGRARYLPSSRGALLSLFPYYASAAFDLANSADREALLPVLVRDYLQELNRGASRIAAAKGGYSAPIAAIELIEERILKGRITATGEIASPGAFIYSNIFDKASPRVDLPMSSVSSSIAEVGPIAVALKTFIEFGDLLVIDEPEAHLHPKNQRWMARALVRLAHAGVTVVAPTHSHTIVHEIGDLIRGARLDESNRQRLGYHAAEGIAPSDVGVYVFRDEGEGVTIKEVEFDDEFGYPEETFFEIAQEQILASHQIDLANMANSIE